MNLIDNDSNVDQLSQFNISQKQAYFEQLQQEKLMYQHHINLENANKNVGQNMIGTKLEEIREIEMSDLRNFRESQSLNNSRQQSEYVQIDERKKTTVPRGTNTPGKWVK